MFVREIYIIYPNKSKSVHLGHLKPTIIVIMTKNANTYSLFNVDIFGK